MSKIVHIGRGDSGEVFCKIERNNGKLSITGVEGPKRNGDAIGACGQIIMHSWGIKSYAPGWSPELEAKFRAVWNKYHLNDMQAGSPAQTAYLEANPVNAVYPESHYVKACESLKAANLNPDPDYLKDGKPYKYGSAWLTIEVPKDVLDFLESLPDSELTPAWV